MARFQTGDNMFESLYSMYEMLLLGEVDGIDASFPGSWIVRPASALLRPATQAPVEPSFHRWCSGGSCRH